MKPKHMMKGIWPPDGMPEEPNFVQGIRLAKRNGYILSNYEIASLEYIDRLRAVAESALDRGELLMPRGSEGRKP